MMTEKEHDNSWGELPKRRFVYMEALRNVHQDLRECLPSRIDGCPGGCKGDHLKLDIIADDGRVYALRLLCLGTKAVRLWAEFKSREAYYIPAGTTPCEAAKIITRQWGYADDLIRKTTVMAANFVQARDQSEIENDKLAAKKRADAVTAFQEGQAAHSAAAEAAFNSGDINEEGMKMTELKDSNSVYRVYEGRPGAVWAAVQHYVWLFDPIGYGTLVTWESSSRARIRRQASCE